MIKTEMVNRSPLRILEQSIHGGLDKGNIGILASKKGVGKTACLVHIAMDKLFQGKHVIHISYSSKVDHIINWYKDIFKGIAKNQKKGFPADVYNEIIKKRVIMNFNQAGTKTDQVLKSLGSIIEEGRFEADTVVVDGFDFSMSNPEELRMFREFALKDGVELWFTASLLGKEPIYNKKGIPFMLERFLEDIEVLITLMYKDDWVRLYLIKNHEFISPGELQLKLDPKTFLIAND
ncbi:MAG: hypothetical protein ACOC6P_03485 [Candidatus Aminicenantaceae bacterium]